VRGGDHETPAGCYKRSARRPGRRGALSFHEHILHPETQPDPEHAAARVTSIGRHA
jgi:hypothetical protein